MLDMLYFCQDNTNLVYLVQQINFCHSGHHDMYPPTLSVRVDRRYAPVGACAMMFGLRLIHEKKFFA